MRIDALIALTLTFALVIVVGLLTLMPISVPAAAVGGDKLHHILAFAALTLPTAVCLPRRLLVVMLLLALYGGAIEVIQPHVGRSAELADWLADLLGIAIGAGLGLILNGVWRRMRAGSSSQARPS